jgi:predicted DCC family thiol-disulfide oxidoreductase YuxK
VSGVSRRSVTSPLILFDGTCGLCNSWVHFVLRFDRAARFRFTPLQSETGAKLLGANRLPVDYIESILLFDDGRMYTGSTAVLRILRNLGFPCSLAYVLILVPRSVREAVYRFIARHRYAWFGRQESCRLPTPAERRRFI